MECSKSPSGKHEFRHFRCIWCGTWHPGALKARVRLSRLMHEQYGVVGTVEVEKDGKTFVVPLAVARAFKMKIVRHIPEEEIESE